ncbi:hypothetical protein BU198_19425 [Streptomyces sp. CBMA156]|nr:hypothetical protein [Streptomyces sp. CBMA156]MBD0672823.1 hypothetical protein [Streptomyces sp. CBMA156]
MRRTGELFGLVLGGRPTPRVTGRSPPAGVQGGVVILLTTGSDGHLEAAWTRTSPGRGSRRGSRRASRRASRWASRRADPGLAADLTTGFTAG